MIISQKLGNLENADLQGRSVDWLALEWHETNKRILHKQSAAGTAIMLRFLNAHPVFAQGDMVYQDEKTIIAIDIQPCEAIVLAPRNMYEMASISYETGNKHLPLFYDNDELLTPFDEPFFWLMNSFGYAVKKRAQEIVPPIKNNRKGPCRYE